jgi:hypothetical protein
VASWTMRTEGGSNVTWQERTPGSEEGERMVEMALVQELMKS